MKKAKILIVEDNNIVMLELKDRLLEMDYDVVDTVSSGLEACDRVNLLRPDLIMMDIRIKGEIDGIETAATIRKKYDTPIIYLTAHTDENTIERAKLTQPYGYIIKPFEEREIRTTIEMALYKYSMEKRLKESEHWLSSTLKSIGDALIATDSNGKIKLINHVGEEITGWSQHDAINRNIEEVFIIKDRDTGELLENPVNISLKTGSIVGETNKIIISKEGNEIPIDFSAAPINYGNDELAGVVLVFKDITERIKAKEIIEQQQIFLRNIIDTDPNYISVKNSEGKYELINKATAEVFGTTPSEMLGKYDNEFFTEEELKNLRKTETQALKLLEEIIIPEEKLIDSEGKIHLLQTFKRAIDSQKEDEKLVLSVANDITDLKNTERALRENERRIHTLLKVIPDIVFRFNKYNMLLDYHAQTQNSLLKNTENITGKNIFEFLGDNLAEEIILFSEKAFSSNRIQTFEYDKEDEAFYYDVRIVNNSDDEYIVIIRDITSIKRSQIELKALNDSKDKFFSIISHDLRSPFSSLISLTDLIADENDDLTLDEIKTLSKSISNSARAIFNLLENLLHWSRVQTGRIDYNPEKIDLYKIIKQILPIYSSNIKNKNISLSINIIEELTAFADSNMTEIILRNLISNALKFTRQKGSIIIDYKENEEFIIINITDNGVGIHPDKMDKLFKIDENISSLGTQNERGSGLGLILCKEFIELNGGKLTVNSKSGEGSVFSFSLPKN